jgi:hypothetical protein
MSASAMLLMLLILLMLLLLLLMFKPVLPSSQTGGEWDDPYAWIRPWFIIDFFRNFWLTR